MLWFFTPSSKKSSSRKTRKSGYRFDVGPQRCRPRPRRIVREVLVFQSREIDLVRRAHKRSLGLTLQVNGRIRVSAPMLVSQSRILEFLQNNQEWINGHLERYKEFRASHPQKKYHDGEKYPLLGENLPLRFVEGAGRKPVFLRIESEIVCKIPSSLWGVFEPIAAHPELAEPLSIFYSSVGRQVIGERVAFFTKQMGLFPSSVHFRSQKTRWGSCSAKGRISLNWRLAIAPLDVIDYVVVHELAHLKHYNHSVEFWQLVGTQVPNYKKLRNWLREHQYDGDFLAKKSELHERE